jgi:uncharacterized membrane protein
MAGSENSRVSRNRTLMLVQLSILVGIQALMAFTVFGSIPTPFSPVAATIAHLPAIVAGMLLGWKAGAFIGFSFGLFSLIVWTFMPPSPFMAFMFTPFWTVPGELAPIMGEACAEFHAPAIRGDIAGCSCVGNTRYHEYVGGIGSLLICFVPRILIGVTSALVAKYVLPKTKSLNYIFGAVVGSMTNTLLVVGGMFLFFAPRIEPIWGEAAGVWLGAIITANGIPEAIVAAVICPAICIPVALVLKKQMRT